jgi:hypothetical protein
LLAMVTLRATTISCELMRVPRSKNLKFQLVHAPVAPKLDLPQAGGVCNTPKVHCRTLGLNNPIMSRMTSLVKWLKCGTCTSATSANCHTRWLLRNYSQID